jgi:hypothetical protein
MPAHTGETTPEVSLTYQVFRTQPDGSVVWEEPKKVSGEATVHGLRNWLGTHLNTLNERRQALLDQLNG